VLLKPVSTSSSSMHMVCCDADTLGQTGNPSKISTYFSLSELHKRETCNQLYESTGMLLFISVVIRILC